MLTNDARMLKSMDELLAAGCAAHPELTFDRERLAAFLAERETPSSAAIAADLCLVFACLEGDALAIATLERNHLALVPQFVARIQQDAAAVDEIQQQLRDRLLLPKGERRPKLAEFTGRGRLASWLRVVATRTALNLRAAEKPNVDSDEVEPMLLANKDAELDYLKERYRDEFRTAFETALAGLEARQRTVLRFQLVDGLSIDRIGEIYDVHRATAARWINQARDSLFKHTRDQLRAELGVSDSEFASIARLVISQLDVSICRILRESNES